MSADSATVVRFTDLPDELLELIAAQLAYADLVHVGAVCSTLRAVSTSESLWRALCNQSSTWARMRSTASRISLQGARAAVPAASIMSCAAEARTARTHWRAARKAEKKRRRKEKKAAKKARRARSSSSGS